MKNNPKFKKLRKIKRKIYDAYEKTCAATSAANKTKRQSISEWKKAAKGVIDSVICQTKDTLAFTDHRESSLFLMKSVFTNKHIVLITFSE